MKNVIIKLNSRLRRFLPLAQKTGLWGRKYCERLGIRLVVSGGRIRFLDAELNFLENAAFKMVSALRKPIFMLLIFCDEP